MSRLLTDIGGPFYDPAKPFRNWSALPYYQLDLPRPPYVDLTQLDRGVARAMHYLERVHEQGYTGVVVDNLAHLVTFDAAPERIYHPAEPARRRALAYSAAFRQLFERAAALGMEVFVTTDMQWTTPAVRRYAGRLTANNPRLAAVNRWALEELFRCFPAVGGVFARVGETGGAHDLDEYVGHMLYRTARDLRLLIDTLLPVCEQADRLLVVRTWSIGIGELGDLLWSRERYHEAFSGYSSRNLLVSVKHGPSDFFRHLAHNPTLGIPGPAQIVELQNRREYELFGMVPSSVAALHRAALHRPGQTQALAGAWAWNASGGWGGGTAALGDDGWSLWTELSSALTAALAHTTELDTAGFVRTWLDRRIAGNGASPAAQSASDFADAAATLYLDSAALLEQGWYHGPLARSTAPLGRVYPPPLLWVWWMRPTVVPWIWAYLAYAVEDIEACLHESGAAVARLDQYVAQLSACCPAGNQHAAFVLESARYMRDCLALAHALRCLMLRTADAARRSDRERWDCLGIQAADLGACCKAHHAAWGGRRDFPALELDEVERYLAQLARRPGLLWSQMRAAVLLVDRLLQRDTGSRLLRPAAITAMALLMLRLGCSRNGRTTLAALLITILAARTQRPALRRFVPWLCRRYFLVPSIFFETGPALTEWVS